MESSFRLLIDWIVEYHWTMVFSLTKWRGGRDERV